MSSLQTAEAGHNTEENEQGANKVGLVFAGQSNGRFHSHCANGQMPPLLLVLFCMSRFRDALTEFHLFSATCRSRCVMDRALERGMDRALERGMDRALERGMDRALERGMGCTVGQGTAVVSVLNAVARRASSICQYCC